MTTVVKHIDDLVSGWPPPDEQSYEDDIRSAISARYDHVIILDDDPTGNQTVYDIPILTTWSTEVIREEMRCNTRIFFILTNSRSMKEAQAVRLVTSISRDINTLANEMSRKCLVISRSDSTLRGHYPAEVVAIERGLDIVDGIRFLIPAFFEGGRYTMEDVHYARQEETLVPAAETAFAQDPIFGYSHSNLVQWAIEKSNNEVDVSSINSISINDIRRKGLDELISQINAIPPSNTCIINAIDISDLQKVTLAILQSRIVPVFRTAASFITALVAQSPQPLLQNFKGNREVGILIVVGSYVPKTTAQVTALMANIPIETVEIDVYSFITGTASDPLVISERIDHLIESGKDVLLYTSRDQLKQDHDQSLHSGGVISAYLSTIVKGLAISPSSIIAKGGITSSDTATQGLGVKRAVVRGQVVDGVSVWRLGPESKFPELDYIVFPGNVGSVDTLWDAFKKVKNWDQI